MSGTATEEVAVMSDLVKRLRDVALGMNYGCNTVYEAADRIKQLERELRVYMDAAEGHMVERMRLTDELAAEKALADELEKVAHGVSWDHPARTAYRKARGL